MLDSIVLDIVIALVFVFLATSLAVTAGNELLASFLKWRARDLAYGLRMLAGAEGPESKDKGSGLVRDVYQHPVIRGLHRETGEAGGRKSPSYIPPKLFATALLDLALRPADGAGKLVEDNAAAISAKIEERRAYLGGPVADALLAFVRKAEADSRTALGSLEKLQRDVEEWFDAGMDRVSGMYKRRTQVACLILSALFVGMLNLDAIRITRTLANDPVLRAALIERATQAQPVAAAGSADESAMTASARSFTQLQADISVITELGIPVGWEGNAPRDNPSWWISKLFGLLVTCLAASLGAPFWFDILKKATNLRQAGRVPERPPEVS